MNQFVKNLLRILQKPKLLIENRFDYLFLNEEVKAPLMVGHSQWKEYILNNFDKKGIRILEVGSREVTGKSEIRTRLKNATYIGFDFYAGNNVDIIGDAHKLSSYFKKNEQFDLIFSSACFEHFAMPWIVATEISSLLKVGGFVFIETHFSFIAHERPWNFFQFSDLGLKVLFSEAMGFECIDCGMSNPIVGRFSSLADGYLQSAPLKGLYCHSEFLGRKVADMPGFDWTLVNLKDVVGGTLYPPKSGIER